jgi:hemerythrin-like domain-containing protein
MNSIELMVDEHRYIIRMLKVVRKACFNILNGEEIIYDDFDKMIDFIKNYADVHHHGKEEKILFTEMVNHLGKIGTNLVTHGMLVEHDLGRLYISELKDALNRVKGGDEESKLDVIANAIGYANHLTRHIAKEDQLIYPFAAGKLTSETLDSIDARVDQFEQEAQENHIQENYKEILEILENKLLI